jgi:hypothetical protein
VFFWYTSKNNRLVNLGYIKRPKIFSRITSNILESIDLFPNSINIRENILRNILEIQPIRDFYAYWELISDILFIYEA